MAASSANRNLDGRVYVGWSVLPYDLKDDAHIYRGTLVVVDSGSNGQVVEFGSYNANYYFVGVAMMEVYNSANAPYQVRGDRVPVAQIGTVILDGSGFGDDDLGKPVYATDDHTVKLSCHTNSTVDALYVGRIIRVVSATQVEVEIDASQSWRAAICVASTMFASA